MYEKWVPGRKNSKSKGPVAGMFGEFTKLGVGQGDLRK